MKLCVVSTAFPRWQGDFRVPFILENAKALVRQGLEVKVVTAHNPGSKTREVMDSINIVRSRYMWPEKFEILQSDTAGLPRSWNENPLTRPLILPFILGMSMATAKTARDCDLIHANWTLSAAISLFSQIYHRRKVLLTVQGSDIFQAAQMPIFRSVTKYVLRRCEKVFAISQSLADETAAIGLPVGGIEVIPNGVDTEFFIPSKAPRENIILFVGSLFERKGVRNLVQAFSIVEDQFPNFSLAIIGEGTQEEELIELAKTLRISRRVHFLGPQPPKEVSAWMRRAKLFVLPSLEEGLGVVLLEALASATPCVGSDVGGIPDILSKDVGILVPPKDPQALANAMQSILTEPRLWESMSRAARMRAEREYAWDEIAAKLIRSYEAVLAQ